MIRTVILGSGISANNYIKHLKFLPAYEILGIFDKGQNDANEIAKNNKIPYLDDPEKIFSSQLIIITGEITIFFNDLRTYLKNAGNLLITELGKQEIQQLDEFFKIAEESKSIIHIGMKKRISSLFSAFKTELKNPRIINYTKSINKDINSDSEFIFNHILYDIDLILDCVSSDVKKITSSGCSIQHIFTDIITIRLEFVNGIVADIIETISGTQPEVDEISVYQAGKVIKLNIKTGILNIEIFEKNKRSNDLKKTFKKENLEKTELEKLIDKNYKIKSITELNYDALKIANQVFEQISIN